MDLLLKVMMTVWDWFCTLGFDITFQGITYHITFLAIFLFTSIVSIALIVLFSFFK